MSGGAGRPVGESDVPSGPDRRQVLTSSAAGIFTLALPAAAAASTGDDQEVGLSAPSVVTAVPIGYVSGGSTGAIRVSWSSVAGADGYEVGWTATVGGAYAFEDAGDVSSHDLVGLVGTDTTHFVVVRSTSGETRSLLSDGASASPVIATGGTVSILTGDGSDDGVLTNAAGTTYVVHTFTDPEATGTFRLRRAIAVDHLVVGGGGGGGSRHGGGGGGGGLLTGSASRGTDGSSTDFSVTVGAGGPGPAAHLNSAPEKPAPDAGDASSVFDLVAPGGGTGGGSAGAAGGAGGSGGGSANGGTLPGAAAGGGVLGNSGGQGTGAFGGPVYTGGGGGGAGSAGGAGSTSPGVLAGAGGAGRASVIATNFGTVYAGGGGGSTSDGTGGQGGSGGGGAGATGNATGADGTANLGGGGGGGGFEGDQNAKGGDGGSGVVILRYALPSTSALPAAPTSLAVQPAGYTGASNGAIEVTWDAVTGASYTVEHRQRDVGAWTATSVTGATRTVITGLDPALNYEARVAATVDGVDSRPSASVQSGAVIASGGTVTSFEGNGAMDGTLTNVSGATYVVHTFTTGTDPKTFQLSRTIDVEYLIVAGGGGGGSRHGGGGGAGGLVSGTAAGRTAGTNTVVVGAGGSGAPEHAWEARLSSVASAGGTSSALGLSAVGGGRGGGSSGGSGGDGGSGGGPSGSDPVGLATSGQGSNGGAGISAQGGPYVGGGGGGAGAVGGSASTSPASAGSGGDGKGSVISGNDSTTYAGGGGGSTSETGYSAGVGGAGGGGDGALGNAEGDNADGNTGGGGGAGGFSTTTSFNRKGGNGGSGIVILRYRLPS